MTETQEHLLQLFKELDDICRKNGIEYYLAGGSLVGAVRHGGFLPWDDDADIHMSIENAEKFRDAVEKIGNPKRTVYVKSDNGDYMNAHWRYQDLSKTLLMRGLTGSSGAQGQFIDIFVTYPLPLDEAEKQRCLDDFEIYVELKAQNTVVDSRRTPEYVEQYWKAKEREKQIGKKEILEELEARMFHFSQEDAKEWFLCAPFPDERVIPKDWWGKPRYVKFESIELPVAEKAEKLLSYSYGPAWFEVPPYADRGEHVFVEDMEIPYTVYTREFNRHLDIDKFYRDEVRKKEFWFDILRTRNVVNPHIRKLQGICTVQEIEYTIEKYGIDLEKMIAQEDKEGLAFLFGPVFSKLRSTAYKYWDLTIDMPDDMMYAALYFSCYDGTYGLAKKMLEDRRELDRELTPNLQRLCDLCDATDELLTALYGDLDYEYAEKLVNEWLPKEPKALYFLRAREYLRLRNKQTDVYEIVLKECDESLALYEDDGELLKYKGDALLGLGCKEEGELCYKKALNTLKNGYCITEIREYFRSNEEECI